MIIGIIPSKDNKYNFELEVVSGGFITESAVQLLPDKVQLGGHSVHFVEVDQQFMHGEVHRAHILEVGDWM